MVKFRPFVDSLSKGVICEFLYKHSTAYSDKFSRLILRPSLEQQSSKTETSLRDKSLDISNPSLPFYPRFTVHQLWLMHYFKADNDQNVNAILSPNLKHSWNSIPISSPRQEAQEILINAQARVPFANVWSSIVWLTVLYSHCYIDWQKPVSDMQAQKSAFCKLQAE